MKRNKSKSNNHCALTHEMIKAYDRVDWTFMEEMLLKLGFCRRWTNWVMQCVRSVRCNGELLEPFSPSRGLRQGDPLSPYLFLLCTEGLTALLNHAEQSGELVGVKVCRDAPSVTNLLFADDSLILMKANVQNATCLKSLLDLYCGASGQLVSVDKSSIFFSPNTSVLVREEVCMTLDILTESLTDKYLGLPTMVGVDRSGCFQHLIDKICQRIKGWKEKVLSGERDLVESSRPSNPLICYVSF